MTQKILISTGGSGGHVIPAITIYNHLKHTHETMIITDIRGLAYLNKDYKYFVILVKICKASCISSNKSFICML